MKPSHSRRYSRFKGISVEQRGSKGPMSEIKAKGDLSTLYRSSRGPQYSVCMYCREAQEDLRGPQKSKGTYNGDLRR